MKTPDEKISYAAISQQMPTPHCDTCKHWAENGAIDPYGEGYCPIDQECENASLYQKKE